MINKDTIIIIFIISLTVLIFCLFVAVNIRRLIKHLSHKRLDAAREEYKDILQPALSDSRYIDYELCQVKRNSVKWKAIEDILFQSITEKRATAEHITTIFERLGYIDIYLEDIVSGNRHERALAADKLGRVRAPQATEYLIRAMNDPARDVRTVASRSLGNINDLRAIDPLMEKLISTAQNPQLLPLRVLKSSIMKYGEDAMPLLLHALKHTSWQVRGQAADVIGEIADTSAYDHLLPLLGDTEPDVRIKAVKALGKIKRAEAFQPIAVMIKDPSCIVRLQAAKTLGCMGVTQAVPYLVELLSDLNWQVREAAVQSISSLGRIADPELLKALLLLKDRFAREQVITELRRTEILDAQFDMLCSADIRERETASLLLVAAGNCGAWDIITNAIRENKNPEVRKRLIHVINLIVNDDAEIVLRTVSESDNDPAVRNVAYSALEKSLSR